MAPIYGVIINNKMDQFPQVQPYSSWHLCENKAKNQIVMIPHWRLCLVDLKK